MSDGVPIGHACRVLSPEFLRAERAKECEHAIAALHEMPILLHDGDFEGPDVYGPAGLPPGAPPGLPFPGSRL